MQKIVVILDGEELELGDKLREMIIKNEEERKTLNLQLEYHDAALEKPSTILRNLEKVGIINWIAPQFKTPSWALPLAQYSRISSTMDLWFVLMDPYKYVRISCNAHSILSQREDTGADSTYSALSCFVPLPVRSTFGYASMTGTHFPGGCDVKAINIRRSQCDSSHGLNDKEASLSVELYDFLQHRVWYPEEEIHSVVSVFEAKGVINFQDNDRRGIGEVTNYIFNESGILRKTYKFEAFLGSNIEDEVKSSSHNPIHSIINAMKPKEEIRHRTFEISTKYFVTTSAGVIETKLTLDIFSQKGLNEKERQKIGSFFSKNMLFKEIIGENNAVELKSLNSIIEKNDICLSFSESLFGFEVRSCRGETDTVKLTDKSLGPYSGALAGVANFALQASKIH